MRQYDWLFPTPVMTVDLSNRDIDLKKCCDMIIDAVATDPTWKNEIHATTQDTLHELPPFSKMVKVIDEEVAHYCDKMLHTDSSDIELVAMWANTHRGVSNHVLHMHANSFISGVLYLNTPDVLKNRNDDKGKLTFEDPREARHVLVPDHRDQFHPEVTKQWDYDTTEGMLILFPGYLKHRVNSFDSGNDYRVSLSFNYMLTRCSVNTRTFNLKTG